jgi:uncharacterized protein YoxC/ElaB/YqjD/DUF883 family membrane-anchored ribosome-binding protein
MANRAELEIVISAVNNAEKELKAARQQIAGIEGEAKKATKSTQPLTDEFAKMTKTLAPLGVALAGVGVAAKQMWDATKFGAQVGAIEERFIALAGSTEMADKYMRDIRESTHYAISEMDAMAGVSRLMQMGLVDNAEAASELTAMALALGDQTKTAQDRVADFSLFLSNQAMLRADNFGMSSGRLRDRIKELQEAFPDMTREVAFTTAVMETGREAMDRLGESTQTMLTDVQSVEAAMTDLKTSGSQAWAELTEPIVKAAAALATFNNRTKDALANHTEQAIDAGMAWEDYVKAQAEAVIKHDQVERSIKRVLLAIPTAGLSELLFADHEQYTDDFIAGIEEAIESGEGFNDTLSKGEYIMRLYQEGIIETADATTRFVDTTYDAETGTNQYRDALMELEGGLVTAKEDLDAVAQSASDVAIAFDQQAASISDATMATFAKNQLEALKAAGLEGEAYAEAQRAILMQYGLLTDGEIAAQASLDELTQAYVRGQIGIDEYVLRTQLLKDAVDVEAGAVADSAVAHQQYQDALNGTIGNLQGVQQAARDTSREIENMITYQQIRIDIDRYYTDHNAAESHEQYQEHSGGNYASGGISSGGRYMVGERGPEMVSLPRGAVTSSSVVNNYDINFHSAAPLNPARDLRMVQALLA